MDESDSKDSNKVREARIAELKAKFQAGELTVDPQKLAALLVEEAISDFQNKSTPTKSTT